MDNIPFAVMLAFYVLSFRPEVPAGERVQNFVFRASNYTFHEKTERSTNWKESRGACKKTGSCLVSIESLEEWTFLKNITQILEVPEYFIGLRKDGKSGEWKWISDGSKVNSSLWAKNEPSGDGNCAVMYKSYRNDYGKYNDLDCATEKRSGYICESPTEGKCNNKEGDSRMCKCITYSFRYKRLSWNSSRKWCKKEGGDLVSIETDKEWKYLTEFITNLTGSKQDEYYIGLVKRNTGSWYWLSDNKTVPDRGWLWQVNTSAGGDCAAMLKYYQEKKGYFIGLSCSCRGTGENNSLSCSSHGKEVNRGFICEKTVDCSCKNGRISDNQVSTASPNAHADGAVVSSTRPKERQSKDRVLFILVIAISSLDVVLLVIAVMLCININAPNQLEVIPCCAPKRLKTRLK